MASSETKPEQEKKMKDGSEPKGKWPKPQTGGTPKKITTPGKPGDSGPGGAHPGTNRPKKKHKPK